MKLKQLVALLWKRNQQIAFSKKLPNYRLYHVTLAGLLLGLLAFAGFLVFGYGRPGSALLVTSAFLIGVMGILNTIVRYRRFERVTYKKDAVNASEDLGKLAERLSKKS